MPLPLLCLALLAFPQKAEADPSKSKVLPLSTKPLKLPAFLQGKKLMSVNQYWNYNGTKTMRVFRYSYPADFKTERDLLRSGECKAWKYEFDPKSWLADFERITKGSVVRQAILLHPFRLVPDSKEKLGIRVLPFEESEGWVWVSYNEEYPRPPK
jgi:hypothetical protein